MMQFKATIKTSKTRVNLLGCFSHPNACPKQTVMDHESDSPRQWTRETRGEYTIVHR